MVDSINFVIKNVEWIDFKHLAQLKVFPKSFGSKTFSIVGYTFWYKNVQFKYYRVSRTLLIKTNAHKIISKQDVTVEDKNTYKKLVSEPVQEILNSTKIEMELTRFDYCVDLKIGDIMKKYFYLYKWHKPKFGYMKIKEVYATSIYRCTKRGKYNLNIYSRYEKTKKEEDKDILRIELQMKKSMTQKEHDIWGVDRDVDNYWSKSSMLGYYFDFLQDFFQKGNHYTLETAKSIIDESDHSDKWKEKLKTFLENLAKNDLEDLKKKKLYSPNTITSYIEKLENLSINIVLLPKIYKQYDGLKNLLDIAREVAKEKYFE